MLMKTDSATSVLDDQATHSFAKDQLKSIVERIERLEEEKKTIADDIREVEQKLGPALTAWKASLLKSEKSA